MKTLILATALVGLLSASQGEATGGPPGEYTEGYIQKEIPLPIQIALKIEDSGDTGEEDSFREEVRRGRHKKEGWTLNSDRQPELKTVLYVEKLPYDKSFSNGSRVRVYRHEKNGQVYVEANYSFSDADGTTTGRLSLPRIDQGKAFIIPSDPLVLDVDGGDQASGAWNINMQLLIRLKATKP